MHKFLAQLAFAASLAVGLFLRACRRPALWIAVVAILALWWGVGRREAALKESNKPPPVVFEPLATANLSAVNASPEPGTPASAASTVNASVMSTTDLETAVGRFHKTELRRPATVEELVEKNYLVGLPDPPPGRRYLLDLRRMELRLVSAAPAVKTAPPAR